MREEYTEYKGRRNRKSSKIQKQSGYFKKLLKQTIVSILIFSAVVSPEFLGLDFGQAIRAIAKSALLYTIDTSAMTDVFKNIYQSKGETNEKEASTKRNI